MGSHKIKSDILWSGNCAYCMENAASNEVTSIPIDKRKGKGAFLSLFEEIEGHSSRDELQLPVYYPTNPQAEVLYFGIIQPTDILGVHFENKKVLKEAEKKLESIRSEIKLTTSNYLFYFRKDYEEWQ